MKNFFTFFLALAASVGTIFAWDYEYVQIDELYYNLDATNQIAAVLSVGTTITSVTIPESVEWNSVTYNVTSIMEAAFFSCSRLTSIEIPNSVTSIGEAAFDGCTGLTSIEISDGVISIGNGAFSDCTGLTSVTIGKSVENIGENAFSGCNNITSVVWNAKNSNGYWFGYQVESFLFGDSVEVIPSGLCSHSQLTSVIIPSSVTSIGDLAFAQCAGLTSITIPDKVSSIGIEAFWACANLTSVSIGKGVTSIGDRAFSYCTGLTSFTIGNGITTSIGVSAFSYCTGLTSFTMGNSVTSIGESAFDGCSGLTSIEISDGVISIGNGAFSDCTGLTSVTIGKSVENIGENAFSGCNNITSVVWNAKNSNGYWFGYQVESFLFGDSVEVIPPGLCAHMDHLSNIAIPRSVTSIGIFAFQSCSNLATVEITDLASWCAITFSAESSNPLYDDNNVIHNNIIWLTINGNPVTDLIIPDSITSIGNYAFCGCTALTSVTIGNSVTRIGRRTFWMCTPSSITCKANTPPTCEEDDEMSAKNSFLSVSRSTPLYVPAESVNAYKSANVWKEFYNIYAIGCYTVTFKDWDETILKTEYVEAGHSATAPANPTRDGYTFTGWDTDFSNVQSDLIVTAQYQQNNITMTCSEAREAAFNGSTAEVFVIGYVTEIATAWHATYNNISFWMADTQNGGRVFEAFRVKCTTQEEAPRVGDKVKVHGNLSVYNQTTPELAEGGTFEILERASVDPTTAIDRTLNEQAPTKVMRNGQLFILRGEELYNAQGARVR